MKTKSIMLLLLKVTKKPTRFAIVFASKGTLLKFILAIYELFPFLSAVRPVRITSSITSKFVENKYSPVSKNRFQNIIR